MSYIERRWPTLEEFSQLLMRDHGCELQHIGQAPTRVAVLTRPLQDRLLHAVIHDNGRKLSFEQVESVLLQLELPLDLFDIFPKFDA